MTLMLVQSVRASILPITVCSNVQKHIYNPYFQVNYVVQEAIVVIKDIFRKYPNKVMNSILLNSSWSTSFQTLWIKKASY